MYAQVPEAVDLPLDALRQYLRWVRNTPSVDDAGEAFLLRKLAKGPMNPSVRERLVALYQPMVISLAKQYVERCTSLEFLDLVQEGNVGLVLALNKITQFDPTSGVSFRTWAFAWIRGQIQYAVWSKDAGMVIPQHMLRRLGQYQLVRGYLTERLQREPNAQEIAAEMGLPDHEFAALHDLSTRKTVSLDIPTTQQAAAQIAEATDQAEPDYRSWFTDALRRLPTQHQQILRLKYGIGGIPPHSIDQIAVRLSIDPKTVVKLDRTAKDNLRRQYVQSQRSHQANEKGDLYRS